MTLPAGLETIAAQTFENCTALTTVTVGNALKVVDDFAFASCTVLATLTLPATIEQIGDYAFAECFALAKPVVADGVEVGTNAFYGTIGA